MLTFELLEGRSVPAAVAFDLVGYELYQRVQLANPLDMGTVPPQARNDQSFSGIAYAENETNASPGVPVPSIYIVDDGGDGDLYRYDFDGDPQFESHHFDIGFANSDPEGIAWMGRPSDGAAARQQFATVQEAGAAPGRISIIQVGQGVVPPDIDHDFDVGNQNEVIRQIDPNPGFAQVDCDGDGVTNDGIEGVAYDRRTGSPNGHFYLVFECGTAMGVYRVLESNGARSTVSIPGLAGTVSDLSDVYFVNYNNTPYLFLLSEAGATDGRIVKVQLNADGTSGTIVQTRVIPATEAWRPEGISFAPGGREMLIVSDTDADDNPPLGQVREYLRYRLQGDFDGNGVVDPLDIDELADAIDIMTPTDRRYGFYDLNGTGTIINNYDRNYFVHRTLDTVYGDANWDGEFNSGDLVQVFEIGEYQDNIPDNSTWFEGDWSGDRDFESDDLVLADQDGCYEKGPGCVPALSDFDP